MAQRLQELPVYLKACAFSVAVAAMIARPSFGRNRKLHDQIADANESILANMEEGFEQSSDAVLANYLYTSKGSIARSLFDSRPPSAAAG
jgi:four helix bundle protein